MNETLKTFLKDHAYQLVTALVVVTLTLISAYVASQLWQQSTIFRIQASEQRITSLERASASQPNPKVMESKISAIAEDVKEIREGQGKLIDHLLNK